ncbi:MAG: universal stress protein, partial [Cyclobacteriaceae bacterium]|nr:universal stress protein [Cyclobacteriaceae bacterium]
MIHVLVPYDFSPLAAHALTFATQLSSHYSHLKITVIHVVEIPLGTGVGTFGGGLDPMPDVQHQLFIKELLEQREKDLNELKNSYASFPFQL